MQTSEIDIFETRLLWWDMTNLTESKIQGWMNAEFRCTSCKSKINPPHLEFKWTCPKCGKVHDISIYRLATPEDQVCCGQKLDLKDPEIQAYLHEHLTCNVCGQVDQRWITRDAVDVVHLFHVTSAWRNRWFNYTLNNYVFYDQRSVRVVPVQYQADVEDTLHAAEEDFEQNILPLDRFKIFGAKWHKKNADFKALWDGIIKFPKFIASDFQAKQAVLDTVKGSILAFVQEANDKVLSKLNGNGKVHKRTAQALQKRLDELKRLDVWGVSQNPEVQVELDALEGLIAAQLPGEEENLNEN